MGARFCVCVCVGAGVGVGMWVCVGGCVPDDIVRHVLLGEEYDQRPFLEISGSFDAQVRGWIVHPRSESFESFLRNHRSGAEQHSQRYSALRQVAHGLLVLFPMKR